MSKEKEMKLGIGIVLGILLGLMIEHLLLGLLLGTIFGLVWGYSDHMLTSTHKKSKPAKRTTVRKSSKSKKRRK